MGSIIRYIQISNTSGMEPNSPWITNHEYRFYLTRFGLNIIHFLIAFPKKVHGLLPSHVAHGCYIRSIYCTLMLLYTLYSTLRVRFLRPILLPKQFTSHKEGLEYHQTLASPEICSSVLRLHYCCYKAEEILCILIFRRPFHLF